MSFLGKQERATYCRGDLRDHEAGRPFECDGSKRARSVDTIGFETCVPYVSAMNVTMSNLVDVHYNLRIAFKTSNRPISVPSAPHSRQPPPRTVDHLLPDIPLHLLDVRHPEQPRAFLN